MKMPVTRFPVEDDILDCVHWRSVERKLLGRPVMAEFYCGRIDVKEVLDKWVLPEGTIDVFRKGCPLGKICKHREGI